MATPSVRDRVPSDLPARLAARLPGPLGGSPPPVVSLVRLHGVIAATAGGVTRSVINAHGMERTLERAFAPSTSRPSRC